MYVCTGAEEFNVEIGGAPGIHKENLDKFSARARNKVAMHTDYLVC